MIRKGFYESKEERTFNKSLRETEEESMQDILFFEEMKKQS